MTNLFPQQKQSLKGFGRSDEGQALVLTALALVVLMLMAGLGVDVGYLRYEKQQMQKAADAGAIAGASALIYNGNWNAAAQNDTSANGYTDTVNGATVRVDRPWEGAFAGRDGYVEVSVLQPQPKFFMRVGGGDDTVPVRSWAVASSIANGPNCIYALDPNDDPKTFLVDGNVSISSYCGIQVNSSSTDALDKNGAAGSVSVNNATIGVVGNYSGGPFHPTPVIHVAPANDPLANVPAPTPDANCITGQPVGNVYNPGTYCGGISISGNNSYTFRPGLYTLRGGGLRVTGSATLSGNGVTFYLTGTPSGYNDYRGVSAKGNSSLSFSAPTDSSNGGVPGILFFQDRSVPVGSDASDFGGSNGTGLIGSLYFPTTSITFEGTPSLVSTATIIVGWKLEFKGNSSLVDYTLLPGGRGPIQSAALVE